MFKTPFLSQFYYNPEIIKMSGDDVAALDMELAKYEKIFLDPDLSKSLISKNELFVSFAISKAENSLLTLTEAQEVHNLLLSNPEYDFIGNKLKNKVRLTQKDHDKLEFFNIAKTFRLLNQSIFDITKLNREFILDVHKRLTIGMDIFTEYLTDFTPYKPGRWRDNNLIEVGSFVPAPHDQIIEGVDELVLWLKNNRNPMGVAVFHSAMYALHPFNNGNKRVCRILEHILMRSVGLNSRNLYSESYYYHTEKARYYKYLFYALEHLNFNHFVSFVMEAMSVSIVSVLKTAIEVERLKFLDKQDLDLSVKSIVKPLVKNRSLQFKNLLRINRNKVSKQTLVSYLQKAVEMEIITKLVEGRNVFYSLNLDIPEILTLVKWMKIVKSKLSYMPDDLKIY